jgi:ATP-dependent protease ClpP protease subunit
MNKQGRAGREETEAEERLSTGSVLSQSEEGSFYCLSVIGEIEGHTSAEGGRKTTRYDHLLPLLFSIEESTDVDGVLLLINTVGGDVEAGMALSELIASMTTPTVSLVLGGGHSIGVPLAVAGQRSFIVPSATMTLHPVRISGTVIGAPQTYRYFHDMQERILSFVAGHSRADRETLAAMMMKPDEMANDVGTILDGEEAVRVGLIDEVGGLDMALGWLKGRMGRG